MANPNPSKPFTKGDPRINRKGRPHDFNALRELAQQIAHEKALSQGQPIVIEGHTATVAEMILRGWATSKNPQLAKAFLEIAFGKVPDNLDVTSGGKPISSSIIVKAVDYRTIASTLAPGPIPDSDSSSEDQSSGNGPEMG